MTSLFQAVTVKAEIDFHPYFKDVTMELFDYEKNHPEILRASLADCTVLRKNSGDFPLDAPGKIAAGMVP